MAHSPSNLRPSGHLYGVWDDRYHYLNWKSRKFMLTKYSLSFYIQVGMVTCFIVAFLFLSNKKLDSRRKLSEELTDAMLEHYQDSILTTTT